MSSQQGREGLRLRELPKALLEGWDGARARVLGAVLLLVLVFVVYWPALRGGFVWDDALVIQKNPLVKGRLGPQSIWFQTDFPLSMTVFWLEWLCWGKNPAGYHAVNIFLHSLSAVLIWRVLARLKIPGGWLAAALFAVHPVCVASVAWISELKNTLSLPLFLFSVWSYLRFDEGTTDDEQDGTRNTEHTPGAPQPDEGASRVAPRRWYWLSLGAFLLALLSKTTTVMLPVVLLGCLWWRRGGLTRKDWVRTTPFFALGLAFGLMSIWFQAHQAMADVKVQTEGFWGRLAGAGMALWFYLAKALLPLNLNMIYPRWQINAAAPLSYLPLLLWCCLFYVCWRFRRGWGRPLLFGLGYFAVTLFPALGFFNMFYLAISRVSDHLQYLSLIGILALVATGLSLISNPASARQLPLPVGEGRGEGEVRTQRPSTLKNGKSSPTIALVSCSVGIALILALAVLSFHRAGILARDETLWRDTLARNPDAWTAHNNLGCILAEQNKLGDAISHFEASLRVNPTNAQAHSNLGKALSLQNRFPEAQTHFRTALQINPNNADIQKSFASALADHGNPAEALEHSREAVRLEPDADSLLQFARLLSQAGQVREAAAQYRKVLALKADSVESLNNLAWLLATSSDDTLRNGPEAVRAAERACRLTGFNEIIPLGTLAAAYAEAGRYNEAVKAAERSLQLAIGAGNDRFAAINRQLLSLYRAGKPYHEPKPKTKSE